MLQRTQLINAYAKEASEQRQTREENLKELITATASFDQISDFEQDDLLDPQMRDLEEDDGFLPPRRSTAQAGSDSVDRPPASLAAFLDHVSLESGEMQAAKDSDAVQMMTIHASKGLEFPVVFLGGLEEGLFPSQMSMNEPGRIEEERRLCYVGITRAEKFLTLSYAESRRIYGEERRTRVSRFVREIPTEFLNEIRMGTVIKPAFQPRPSVSTSSFDPDLLEESNGLRAGIRVMHRAFGEGVVLATEGRGVRMRVQVNFTRAGSKWLMANVAKLEPV
jgi:DNA helicase-2/ATP-dependent DNA helicase PcrA